MAAGDTSIRICSDALLILGAKPISSFSEGTDAANICDRLYPNIRDATIQQYPWAFSFKKVSLSQIITAPVNEWRYAYQLPADRIGPPRAAFTSTSVGERPFTEWEIYEDKLLTNSPTIVIDYQFSVPENKMPVYFVQLLKYMMAWHLAEPLTDQVSKAQYWQVVAVGTPGDNGRGGYFRTAANIDGQGTPPQSIEDYSLIAVRY
jgi:hypothetical protein